MARILLIADELNSVSWAFASSLHQQRQEVLLLTAPNSDFGEVPTFPILTPFRKWTALEGFRALPQIASWNPEIFHFLFTKENSRSRPAHWVLASLAHGIPGRTVASSFFFSQQVRSFGDLAFLKLVDLRTFGSRSHMMRVRREKWISGPGVNDVLPPLDMEFGRSKQRVRAEVEKLQQQLQFFLVMPCPPPRNLDLLPLQKRGCEVLLLGNRRSGRSEFYYSGLLSSVETDFLIQKSRALVLAGCDLSVEELRRFHQRADRSQTPLVVSRYQNEILPGLCTHQKTGWVLERGIDELASLLDQNPRLDLPRGGSVPAYSEQTDSTLNELLRLYQRAYSERWMN